MATKILQTCAKWVCNSRECIIINKSPKQLTNITGKKDINLLPVCFLPLPIKNMAILITIIYNITKNLSSPLVHDDSSCI